MTANDGHPQTTTRHRRLWLFAPLIFIFLIVVLVGAVWHWRSTLAERVLPAAAQKAGIELVDVSVDRFDFTGAELSQLRFAQSGSQRIAVAKLSWTIAGLRDRRVRSVEISGADLQALVDGDGKIFLDGLLPPPKPDQPTGGFAYPADLPFQRLAVTESRISVALPDGRADIGVEGHLEVLSDRLVSEVNADYSAETERGSGTGRGSASLAWPAIGAPAGVVSLVFDRLVTANAVATNIRLSGRTEGLPERLADISFSAEGTADTIESSQLAARDVQLSAELVAGKLDMRGDGNILDWNVALSSQLRPFDLSAPAKLKLKANGEASKLSPYVARMSARGEVAIEVDGEVSNPAQLFDKRDGIARDPAMVAGHISGRLKLQADLQQFTLVDMLQTGDVGADVSARWRDGILDMEFDEATHFDKVTLTPEIERRIAAWLPGVSPFDVTLVERKGRPASVQLTTHDGLIEARVVGGAKLGLPKGAVEFAVDGGATRSFANGFERFDATVLDINLVSLPTKFGSVNADLSVTDLSGDGESLAGEVGGEMQVSDAAAGAVSAHQISVDIDGGVQVTPDEMSVVLSPGDRASLREVRVKGGTALPGTTRFQLADGSHRLAINRRDGAITLNVRVIPGQAKIRSAARTLDLAHKALAITGTWPGEIDIFAENLAADVGSGRGLDSTNLRMRAEGKPSDAVVAIALQNARAILPGLTLPPFDMTTKIVRKGPSLDGDLAIVATGGQPSLHARGSHNLKSGNGEAEIVEASLRFAPGVLQPEDLSPAIAGTLENVFATITLRGPVAWKKSGALTPNLILAIDDLAGSTKNLDLFDAHASIALTGLPALATPPGQQFTGQIRVGRLDPVPLDVSFQLLPNAADSGPRLLIEKLQAELVDGRISTNKFELVPPSIDTDFTLHIEGADLARAFEVIGIAGIGGTGRINGDIPIKVRGNQVAISGGRLANDGPGVVFYDVASLPPSLLERDDTVTLILQALSNFAYDELLVDMDKALDGPGTLRTRLTGANPDVLENQPFIFNINLDSNFDRLAALVLEGLTTSQGLLRALALSPNNNGESIAPP